MKDSEAPAEHADYSRQIALPEIGMAGQRRLAAASALIVGAGGLGSPAALYLAAAGVGRIGLVDHDRVERSNLHRQILFERAHVGRLKVEVAANRLRRANPSADIVRYPTRLDAGNALALLSGYDVVLDGTDVFETRYAINDACVAAAVPNVFASISRFEGQVGVFAVPGGPCYRCVFSAPPPPGQVPNCEEGGVLNVLPGLVGLVQATEALKLLLGIGTPLVGRLLLVDALAMRFRSFHVEKDVACTACGPHRERARAVPPHTPSTSTPMATNPIPEITVDDLQQLRARGDAPFVLDVRRPEEYEIANLGGALIPLQELPERISELASHRSDPLIVVHCRSGARSAQAVALLQREGFSNAVNLKGGILAWSDEIDPSLPKY